jgi:YqjK-like protein
MSNHASAVSERRRQLQLRCTAQRAELLEIGDDLQRRLHHTDRVIEIAKHLTSTPLLLAAGLGLLAILGPTGLVRWSSRAVLLISGVRRFTRWAS